VSSLNAVLRVMEDDKLGSETASTAFLVTIVSVTTENSLTVTNKHVQHGINGPIGENAVFHAVVVFM